MAEMIAGYILYVDGTATFVAKSLHEAQQESKLYINSKKPLRIKSAVAPAPSQIWNYDYSISAWVESR